jgi:hypothetical protein
LSRPFVYLAFERAYHPRHVHLRRAILLFALVLGLTALAAAVSPSRETELPPVTPAAATPAADVLPREIPFEARESGRPPVRHARAGDHVVVTVASTEGGLVTIPRLGRTASVSAGDPARFDLLAPAAGSYDVMIELSAAPTEPHRVGTLVTRP